MAAEVPRATLLLLLVAAACGSRDDHRDARDRYATETLEPGRGIGALSVGRTTLGEVTTLFGETNAFEHRPGTSAHHYANGLTIVTEPARDPLGVIRTINAMEENPYGGEGFRGRTDKGIALGATREEVIAAYGEPVDFGSLKGILHYKTGIGFILRRGRVTEIVIQRPSP
jgi:hypothetical protein